VERRFTKSLTVAPDQTILVGRQLEADIWLANEEVALQQALITRQAGGWLVKNLNPDHPTRFFGPDGSLQIINAEITLPSGELLVGDAHIALF
jgi:phage repressor protein C with HTH and peptisase S24 domain